MEIAHNINPEAKSHKFSSGCVSSILNEQQN